ncbi:MAG: hypothetical protein IRZ08_18910, partial [Frankia sp.]|nr:hypothetical protein [Frankia sp.]
MRRSGRSDETEGAGQRAWLAVGILGACMLFAALTTLTALAVPPFTSADEAQHTSYAMDVGEGSLPVVATPVRARIPGMPGIHADCQVSAEQARAGVEAIRARLETGPRPDYGETVAPEAERANALPPCADIRDNRQLTYTANHPPLFYAVESIPLRIGIETDHPEAGFRAARAVNVAAGTAAIVAVAALVRVLLPNRPDLAVATAALTATVGMLVNASGQLYNDALALATTTAALVATLVLIRRGPSPARLILWCLALLAAASTRASGLLAACLLIPAAALGVALHRYPGRQRRNRPAPRQEPTEGVAALEMMMDPGPEAGTLDAAPASTTRVLLAADRNDRPDPIDPADGLEPVDSAAGGTETEAAPPLGRWRQIARGAAVLLAGTAVAAGGIGWFYLRNLRLYGDPTASDMIAMMFPTEEPDLSIAQILTSRDFWSEIYWGIHGRPELLDDGRWTPWIPWLIAWAAAIGLALALLRRLARWLTSRQQETPTAWPTTSQETAGDRGAARLRRPLAMALADWTTPSPDTPAHPRVEDAARWPSPLSALIAWTVVVLHVALAAATLVGYVAAGGAWFARYLLPAIPLAALLLAAALAAIPTARRGLPTVLATAALATTCALMLTRELAYKHDELARLTPVDRLRTALTMSGMDAPDPFLWSLAGAAAIGLILIAVALWPLSRTAVPRWP